MPEGPKGIENLADLELDGQNPNRGTKAGQGMVDRSLRKLGAGRSILVDKDGKVVAGNKTVRSARALNLPVRVVQTDGTELVVVQRTDLDAESVTGREMAIADNRAGQVGLEWDGEIIGELAAVMDMEQYFDKDELEEMMGGGGEEEVEAEVPFSEFIGEASNYVVLRFTNDMDWLNALDHFQLVTKCARRQDGKPWSRGIGRVVDGGAYLTRVQGQGDEE